MRDSHMAGLIRELAAFYLDDVDDVAAVDELAAEFEAALDDRWAEGRKQANPLEGLTPWPKPWRLGEPR